MNKINSKNFKLSPKSYSLINFLKKEITGNYKIENNIIFLESKNDFLKLKVNLSNILEDLGFDNYKIDELKFFTKNFIIITFIDDNKEEYVKIFFENNFTKEIKCYINKILG